MPMWRSAVRTGWAVVATVFCLVAHAADSRKANEPPQFLLSPAERAWVAANPVLKVAFIDHTIAPLQSWTADGRPDGVVGEYLALLSARTGLKMEPVRSPTLAQRDADFVAGRTDLLPLVLRGDALEASVLTSLPYFNAPAVFVTRRDQLGFAASGRLAGLRVAVMPGSAFDLYVQRRFPDAVRVEVPTPLDELKAVSDGRADVRLGQLPTTVHAIESQLLANLTVRAFADDAPGSYAMGVRRSQPLLHALVDRALRSITPAEHEAIRARWVPARTYVDFDALGMLLNEAERQWLREHPRLRVAYDRGFAPFTFEHDRRLQGLGADLLREVARRLELDIAETRAGTWTEAYQAARRGEVDLLVAAAPNEERLAEFEFVGPWSTSPTAIVTARSATGPLDIGDLNGRCLVLQDDHFLLPRLARKYPGIRVRTLPTPDDALRLVRAGACDAALGNMHLMSQLIQRDHPGTLTVNGVVADGDSELYFAVRRDRPQLAAVFRKGLDAISESERSRLRLKWLAVNYQPGWTLVQALALFGPGLLAAAAIVWVVRRSNRQLEREIAQRRGAEARLADALDREQARSQSMIRFVAWLSHEIRNPLGAIVSAAGVLARETRGADSARLVAGIQQAGDGLVDLLTRTLDVSKAEAGLLTVRARWVAPRAWCDGIVVPFAALARDKGVQVRVQPEGLDGVEAEFDPVRLGQVLANLLSNAIKFTPAGGEVQVGLRLDRDAGRLHLRVQDSGPGIPSAERERLFQPFSQLPSTQERHAEGWGLGLALCAKIVAQMNGRIDVAPALATGARFDAELPVAWRAPVAEAPAAPVAVPAAAAAWRHEPLLLVDDDPVNLLVTTETLRADGWQAVQAFGDAESAFAHWQRHGARVVVTDLRMPGLDGVELARLLRQAAGSGPARPWIVALTGHADPGEAAACRAAGIDEVMLKPLQPAVLAARLAALASAEPAAAPLPAGGALQSAR
jgi:two-component system, NarL family, sensor histidine kinase EvgS